MREYATALDVDLAEQGNLTDDVVRNGTEHPGAVVLARRSDPRAPWTDVTAAAFLAEVRAVAKGLVAAGVEPGDRVALVSRTRWEWTLLDYATWFAGAVGVPAYDTAGEEQLGWLLADCGARAVVVEDERLAARVAAVRPDLPELHHVWTIEPARGQGRGAVDLLTRLGADVDDAELERRRTAAGPDDLATIVYTSGTTGPARGCMLTHGNLDAELALTLGALDELFGTRPDDGPDPDHDHDPDPDHDPDGGPDHDPDDEGGPDDGDDGPTTLLILPLAHVFARVVQVGAVRARVRLGHSNDVRRLVPDLESLRPTFVLAVPRVFEKLFNTASQRAVADGRGALFDRAADTAIAWSRAQDAGRVPLALRARHRLHDRLVYRRLRAQLGGRCRWAISGGAPLGERLAHFYRGIGLGVLEGYGLTETTAAVTVNLPDVQQLGTVGRPLPGVAVRVADDGELLVRGPQVFAGYWGDDDGTAEVRDEHGWLRTGDLGEIDDEGFVRIIGRKKEILVTAGGKNVSPARLEDLLRAHPLVDQALVVGDGRPYVAALLTLDPETVPAWAEQHGLPPDPRRLVGDATLRAELQRAVDHANAAVSRAESVREFAVLDDAWTEEGGQLTPSLKLRRQVLLRAHRRDVDALYRA